MGVSNFTALHLRRLIDETGTVPALNQVELHPKLPQRELRAFHAEHGIATQAWSPLARDGLLDDPAVRRIADAHGRSPAQVLLRWHVELGNVVIPSHGRRRGSRRTSTSSTSRSPPPTTPRSPRWTAGTGWGRTRTASRVDACPPRQRARWWRSTASAAPLPGTPAIPPVGAVPAPEMNSPGTGVR